MKERISSTSEFATHAKVHQCAPEMMKNHGSTEQMTYNEIFSGRQPEKTSWNSFAVKASKLTYSSCCNIFSFNF